MTRNFLFLSALTSLFNLLCAGNAQSAAADIDQYYDHDLDRALANSLADQGGGAGQEEADLQEAIRRSNAELSKRPASSKAVTKNPFLQHVASLVTAADLKDGNYIGKNKEVEKLFQQPDYETWHQAFLTYGIKGGEKPTGLEIVYFLQTLQESQLSEEINALVNHALLEIISGCWGFTKDPVAPAIITRIKGILNGVAQHATTNLTDDAFNQKVASVSALKKFNNDPFFHSHYAEVLSCLNEGFFEDKPEKAYELLELQQAMVMSYGIEGAHYTKVFTKAGYYIESQITVEQLIETAQYRNSGLEVHKDHIDKLQKYISSWDADSPGISENLENLKLFQALIAAQPLFNRYNVEAIKQRILDKLDHLKDWKDEDKKVMAEILFESLQQYDFKGQEDKVYEAALKSPKVTKHLSRPLDVKVLNDSIYIILMEYANAINDSNQLKREGYMVRYGGYSYYNISPQSAVYRHLSLRQQQAINRLEVLRNYPALGAEQKDEVTAIFEGLKTDKIINELAQDKKITKEEHDWLLGCASIEAMAKVETKLLPSGGVLHANYSIQERGVYQFGPLSRAMQYLVATKRFDRSLRWPCLLMFNVGILD